jgi:hypothetical protein
VIYRTSCVSIQLILCAAVGVSISAEKAAPPVTPALGKQKAELRGYLQKQGGTRPEKPSVPVGKPANYWHCLKQYEAVKGDKRRLYALIAEHLRLAEALLQQESVEVKRSAVGVLLAAGRCAADHVQDHRLAAEISELWLLPNLELAHPQRWKHPSRQMVIEEATLAFGRDKRYQRMADVAATWVEGAKTANLADSGRLQLARALDELGKTSEALQVLQEITDESLKPDRDLIPALKRKLEAKQKLTPANTK